MIKADATPRSQSEKSVLSARGLLVMEFMRQKSAFSAGVTIMREDAAPSQPRQQ